MNPADGARAHLEKAQEFFEAARLAFEFGFMSAATASAVTSAINSKDAICLCLTGTSEKSSNHAAAVGELRAAGPEAAPLAPALSRLLASRSKSQYLADPVPQSEAKAALRNAGRMLEVAKSISSG